MKKQRQNKIVCVDIINNTKTDLVFLRFLHSLRHTTHYTVHNTIIAAWLWETAKLIILSNRQRSESVAKRFYFAMYGIGWMQLQRCEGGIGPSSVRFRRLYDSSPSIKKFETNSFLYSKMIPHWIAITLSVTLTLNLVILERYNNVEPLSNRF